MLFRRLRRRLLAMRVRLGAGLSAAVVVGAATGNLVLGTGPLAGNAPLYVNLVALCAIVFALTRTRAGRRRPHALTGLFLAGVTASLLLRLAEPPPNPGLLIGPFVCLLMGSAVIFPWGSAAQAVAAVSIAGAYAVTLAAIDLPASARPRDLATTLGGSVLLSIFGAYILDRSRWSAFVERQRVRTLAIQRRALIDISQDLWSVLDPAVVAGKIARRARLLVPAEVTVLALRDEDDATLRVVEVDGDAGAVVLAGLALDTAPTRGGVREGPPRLGDPESSLPFARMLSASIGAAGEPAGALWWLREHPAPFTRAEQTAAEGLAEQAVSALRAARLFDEARRASRLKSEFVSTMSHELRTPLNVIVGYSEILSETVAADEDGRRALLSMRRAGLELIDLVDSTLDLGRLEAGRERLDEERRDVRSLFRELALEMEGVPRLPGVALQWEAESHAALTVDCRKLKTVLKNLVGNALKFTASGFVRAECKVDGDHLRFRVIDTGIGIAAEDQRVVFEMFRQADSSDTRRYGGTGLGLYIVQQLVRVMGGALALESTPGKGSTFTVTLPVAGARASRAAA